MIDQQAMWAALTFGFTTAILATPLFWVIQKFVFRQQAPIKRLPIYFAIMVILLPIMHYASSLF